MDFRVVWLSGVVVGTAAAAACEAPDPGEVTFTERQTDPTGGSSGTSSTGGSSGDTTDGGSTSGGTDSGPGDPVFGQSVFAPGNPGKNANAQASHAGSTPLQGKNCFQAGG